MNRLSSLVAAGLVLASTATQAASWPSNPFGTVFAPWNTMPGGFSPFNNAFSSGAPWGMSPFSMSPFGGSGTPWGAMPSNTMPWNAWSSGSIVPWANRMPLNNRSGNSWLPNMNGIPSPWGGNNNGWNNWGGWSPWASGNRRTRNNRNRGNRDWARNMMLLQGLNNSSQRLPVMPGMGAYPAYSYAQPSRVGPGAVAAQYPTQMNRSPAPSSVWGTGQQQVTQPVPKASTTTTTQRSFNPFVAMPTPPAPPSPPQAVGQMFDPFAASSQPATPTGVAPAQPIPAPPAVPSPPQAVGRMFDPFAASSQSAAPTGIVPQPVPAPPAPAYRNPFGTGEKQQGTAINGLRFPDAGSL